MVFAGLLGGSLRILKHLYLVRMNLTSLYRLEIEKEGTNLFNMALCFELKEFLKSASFLPLGLVQSCVQFSSSITTKENTPIELNILI